MNPITIHVDGGMAGTKHAGAAAIARTQEGYFLGWLSCQLPAMTNNEAEYHAAQLGLKLAQTLGAKYVVIASDSEVIVRQMRGQSRVLSQKLKRLHQQTCTQTAVFQQVTFHHIPREENHLADALATEAMSGRIVQMPTLATSPRPHNNTQSWLTRLMRSTP